MKEYNCDGTQHYHNWTGHAIAKCNCNKKEDKPMVTIPLEEYNALKESSLKLKKLEAYGVDNWSYYGEALSDPEGIFEGEDDEE